MGHIQEAKAQDGNDHVVMISLTESDLARVIQGEMYVAQALEPPEGEAKQTIAILLCENNEEFQAKFFDLLNDVSKGLELD